MTSKLTSEMTPEERRKKAAYTAKYQTKHKERLKEYHAKYRIEHKNRLKENRIKRKKRLQEYEINILEERKRLQRAVNYYAENKERILARSSLEAKARKRQYDAKRRAIKRDQMPMANPDFRITFTEEMTALMILGVRQNRNREFLAAEIGVSECRLYKELASVGLSKSKLGVKS